MSYPLLANILYETENGRTVLHAMPLLLGVLCVLAIAYRYYSAFLAARVAALDDARLTPAHRLNDGQNYHPTNKWVLFGHHFAAISGAGPLIGPVLAIQYGYMPGLLCLVIGVCLGGAVQDMLVLAASVRSGGKSLAEIARAGPGPVAGLGGEVVKRPAGTEILIPHDKWMRLWSDPEARRETLQFPPGCTVRYRPDQPGSLRAEPFQVLLPRPDEPPDVGVIPTIRGGPNDI